MLVNWLAVDEPDLTTGPAISLHDRFLVVARSHRLATRTSVLIEDLADEQVALLPPPFPSALYDAILPPRTPSGRSIPRTQLVYSINEIAAPVTHGRIVHVTMSGVPVFARDDAALIPIQDLAPIPLGLIWSTARERQDPRPRRSRPRDWALPGWQSPMTPRGRLAILASCSRVHPATGPGRRVLAASARWHDGQLGHVS